jgi:phytoene/squalene synthetase
MAEPPSNERLYCWEQIARANPLFRISHAFAPKALADRLLPLYALFAALEQLCAQTSEAEVRHRKLDWWRTECLVSGPAASDHPVLRELTRSGAAACLEKAVLTQLLDSAEVRLDGPAPVDARELEALCRMIGHPQCALESAVADNGGAVRMPVTAACIGLAQLLRESAGQGGTVRFWWLPLNLMARHGVSRADLAQDIDSAPARALFAEVLQLGRCWAPTPVQEVETAAGGIPALRHLAVHAQLQRNAVRRLKGVRPSEYRTALRRAGPRELFQAWRAASRVSRR